MKLEDAVGSGVLIGTSGLLAHVAMEGADSLLELLVMLLASPVSWTAMALGAGGFILLQRALYKERIAYVVPLVSAISVITPVIASVILLGEFVPFQRWLGIWLILVGVIGISRGEWREGLLASITSVFRKKE